MLKKDSYGENKPSIVRLNLLSNKTTVNDERL